MHNCLSIPEWPLKCERTEALEQLRGASKNERQGRQLTIFLSLARLQGQLRLLYEFTPCSAITA